MLCRTTHLDIRVGYGHVMWGERSVTHCLTHISCLYLVVNMGISQGLVSAPCENTNTDNFSAIQKSQFRNYYYYYTDTLLCRVFIDI